MAERKLETKTINGKLHTKYEGDQNWVIKNGS